MRDRLTWLYLITIARFAEFWRRWFCRLFGHNETIKCTDYYLQATVAHAIYWECERCGRIEPITNHMTKKAA